MLGLYKVVAVIAAILAVICLVLAIGALGQRGGALVSTPLFAGAGGLAASSLLWYALYKIIEAVRITAREASAQTKYLKQIADGYGGLVSAQAPSSSVTPPKATGQRSKSLDELAKEGPIYSS